MEVDYILCSAMELGELTALEETVLRKHQAAFGALDRMMHSKQALPPHFLQNTARAVLSNMPREEQYFFSLCSTAALTWSLPAMCERAAHLVQTRVQNDLGVREDLLTTLFSELAADRYTPHIQSEADIGEGTIREMLNELLAPAMNRLLDDLALLREALHWYEIDQGEIFRKLLQGQRAPTSQIGHSVHEALARRQRQEKARHRVALAKAKAAIKKATKLFQNLGQESNLKLFVSGAEVVLSHPGSPFKLVVKPLEVEGWLIDRTQHGRSHTPYELTWCTKEDIFLAKLCVYFDNTPVLDQLLALTFYVQAGDEVQILEKANWFATSDWNEEKSALVRQAYPQLESKLPRKEIKQVRQPLPISRKFQKEEAHWAPFKGRVQQWIAIWFEPAVKEVQQLQPQLQGPIGQLQQVQSAQLLAA